MPKYCSWNVDREGKRFVRFRRGGFDLYLKGALFSEAWWQQYASAMEGIEPDRSGIVAPARVVPGSMNDLVQAYYRSAAFRDLKPSTQTSRRYIIGAFSKQFGANPVKLLSRRHVADIIGAKADTPMAANNLLKTLRLLLDLAVEREMIAVNPALGVKLYRSNSEGHPTWSEDEVLAFEARHPPGSKARLALTLGLYTGQRCGDVVRMGWQHIQGDQIFVRQEKTDTPLLITMHPVLTAALRDLPRKNLTFLMTERGAPYASKNFGIWFSDRCKEAGLAQRSFHGLRKLATVRMVEAGCTNEQIKSVTGHRSDSALRPYTRKADQAKLARQALAMQIGAEREQQLSSKPIPLDKKAGK